ncbi:hypothetical protein MMC10_010792 [Thelotrema lepadinum]|nr:hypothetical protein [Thelotrema lepadinum]
MAASKFRVLISGAGIAGSCCAYWLARARPGFAITIIERSPSPRVTGQSIDMHGPAIDIIKAMKLDEAVRARLTTETGTRMINSSGKAFASFERGDAFTADYEILRADLSQVFLEATGKLSNIEYKYGDYVKSLEQTDKCVNVTFNGGSKDTYDLVVGADGSTSKTRSMIFDEETLKDSYNLLGQYLAFFSIPSQPSDTKLWYWYNTPKGLCIMTRPHRTGTTTGAYLAVTLPKKGLRDPVVEDAMKQGPHGEKRVLREIFQNAGWQASRVLDGMDQADDFYMTRAAQVKLSKWTNNRVVLIGDAAFATFGVGTTLAIESAFYLAGELSKIECSSDIPQALEDYEKAFRPLYATMDERIPGFPQIAFPQTSWGLWVRDSLLWVASKTKFYRLLPNETKNTWELPCYNWTSI